MSRRWRTLIIGVGSIGERHVRCFQATERADVAICEPKSKLRDEVAKRYRIAESYASLESALKQAFDLAVVATPAPLHVPQAQSLVGRGVSALIEKPLSLNLQGLSQLESAV